MTSTKTTCPKTLLQFSLPSPSPTYRRDNGSSVACMVSSLGEPVTSISTLLSLICKYCRFENFRFLFFAKIWQHSLSHFSYRSVSFLKRQNEERFLYLFTYSVCFTVAPMRHLIRVLYVGKSTSYLDHKCANTFRE